MWLSQTVKFMWVFILVEVYIHTSEQNDVYIGVIFGHETDDGVYESILKDAVAIVNRNSTFLSGQHQMELKEQTLYANYVYPSLQEVCNTMVQTERVSALILPEDVCPMCGDIAAMASHATSPVFSLDPGSLRSGSVAFKMYPSPSDISEFFLDMLIYFNWRNFMIIYDTDQIYANLEDVISAGNIYKWNITLRKYDNNFNRIVDFIREEEIRNIFLYTSTEKTTRKIMEMGLEEGVVSDQHHWIVGNIDVYLDRVFLEDLEESRAYMTRFKMNYTTQWQYSYPSSHDRRLYEWPLRERLSFDAVMAIAHGMRRYRERVRAGGNIEDINILPGDTMMNSCPINSDPPLRAEWNEDLTYYTFEGLTGNVAFDSNGDRVNYTIMVYSGQGETFDTVRGEWSQNPAHWESRYDIEWKSEGRLNVTKYVLGLERRLKVVSILQAPFLMYRDNADRYRGNARFRGYIMDLLEEIARVVKGINFEYEVELVLSLIHI
ncbi:glutamate receptor 3-like [Anneissia japonica]|uniref:glutamate receptor 3-like n=1 Tax=Anneissia japonica TaxID=1529436 RepID=UPI0014254F9F|nr:glutamate receptor 3-like [Anneissia japonica]